MGSKRHKLGNTRIARAALAVLAMGALGAIVFRPSAPKTGDRRPLRPAAVADGDTTPGFRGERVPQDPEFDRFLSLRTLAQAWAERESTLTRFHWRANRAGPLVQHALSE